MKHLNPVLRKIDFNDEEFKKLFSFYYLKSLYFMHLAGFEPAVSFTRNGL